MKKLLLAIAVLVSVTACKKESPDSVSCYECRGLNSNPAYTDAGCYTLSDWNGLTWTDANGLPIDKSTNCRKK